MTGIRREAIRRFAQSRGVAPEALDLDSELADEEDEEVVEDLCRLAGLTTEDVFPPWPTTRRSELAVSGLRRLAPISSRAADRLAELRLHWEVPTLESFIRSLEERRPVGSGRWEETQDAPIPPARTLVRFLAWSLLPAISLTFLVWSGCNPLCRACPTLSDVMWFPGLLPMAATAGLHALMLLAALRELQRRPSAAAIAQP